MKTPLLKDVANNIPRGVALMGIDVGAKTLGLAVCNPQQTIATPLQTIKRTKFMKDMTTLQAIAAEYEIGGFIIGLPMNMDETEGRRAQSVRDFALEMQRIMGAETFIALWDERLSTDFVEGFVDNLVDKRKTKIQAKKSGLIDKLAAQVILQGAIDFSTTNGHE